jgi:hypothetical protein
MRLPHSVILTVMVPLLTLACCLLILPQQPAVQPFVPIGLWYAGPGARPPDMAAGDLDAVRLDLGAIRRAGFNAITTWIDWPVAEPARGAYAFAAAERLIATAAQADLEVDVRLFAGTPPRWSSDVAADRRRFLADAQKRLLPTPRVMSVEPADAASPGAGAIRVGPGGRTPVEARLDFWAALARGARRVMFMETRGGVGPAVLALGETAGIVTRNQALFGPLRPRDGGVRGVTGASGAPVDVKLLESADALMIVALNYSPAPQAVTINFAADMPEAIWQNLETGAAVHFVMGRDGPSLAHTFAPRDAMVLMIRKTLR